MHSLNGMGWGGTMVGVQAQTRLMKCTMKNLGDMEEADTWQIWRQITQVRKEKDKFTDFS